MASKLGAGISIAIGSEKLILTQRQGDSSYRTYFGLQVRETYFHNGSVNLQDVEGTRHLLLDHYFADWSEEYQSVIRHATNFRAWPLYTLSTDDLKWESVPGFTIVGDAAHLSIPNGEGVNLAMFDALQLASKIVEYGTNNCDLAVQKYEADMFPRGVESIIEGIEMSDVMFSGDPQAFLQHLNSKMAAAESTS